MNHILYLLLAFVSLSCNKKYKMPDSFYDLSSNQVSGYTITPSSSGLIQWEGRGADYHSLKVDSIPDHLPWDTMPAKDTGLLQRLNYYPIPEGMVIKFYEFPKRDWERDDNWKRIRDVIDTAYQCPTVYFQDSMFSTVDPDTTHCPGKAVMVRYQTAWIDSVYAKAVVWMFEHGGYVQVENMKIIVRVKKSETYSVDWSHPREPLFGLIPYRINEELEQVVHIINNKGVKAAYIDKILETYKVEK